MLCGVNFHQLIQNEYMSYLIINVLVGKKINLHKGSMMQTLLPYFSPK